MVEHTKLASLNAIQNVKTNARAFIILGWLVVIFGLGGAILWAALAPLDKGVSSQGQVIVVGNRKKIQAPVNGVVKNILVNDGDRVVAGQVLVVLSQEQVLYRINSLTYQYLNSMASTNRLLAEQQNKEEINFSALLLNFNAQSQVQKIIALQRQLFLSRRQALKNELDGHYQSIDGMRLQIKSLRDSRINKQLQISTLNEQMRHMKQLSAEGYVPRNRYLELQRQYAQARSDSDESVGRIGQLQKQLQETKFRIAQRIADYQREVGKELSQVQIEINDVKSRLDAAKHELGYTEIKSPVSGLVIGKTVFTHGGVVNTSEHLMDIVPEERNLIIDARLRIDMVDKVYNGLPVDLMFTAFNQARIPGIYGEVTFISADRLTDKNSGEPYYQMQVKVRSEDVMNSRLKEIKPGMAVEVFIKTGSRSLLNYLFKPLVDRASTALAEE